MKVIVVSVIKNNKTEVTDVYYDVIQLDSNKIRKDKFLSDEAISKVTLEEFEVK